MNHMPFPAHFLHFKSIHEMSLASVLEFQDCLPPITTTKIQKYIDHLQQENWQPHNFEHTFALTVECDVTFSEDVTHPISIAIEYSDQTGHWVQLIDEINHSQLKHGHFYGEVIFSPHKAMDHVTLICAGVEEHVAINMDKLIIKPHQLVA